MHERDGEHSAVVCMLVYVRPSAASASMFGVRDRAAVAAEVAEAGVVEDDEEHVRGVLGGRFGAGQAGVDSSAVRAITPGNVAPG